MLQLELHQLEYRWPGAAAALFSGITTTVDNTEYIGLTGHNGAGKSTLFSLIKGDLQADVGTVTDHTGGKIQQLPQIENFVHCQTVADYFFTAKPQLAQTRKKMLDFLCDNTSNFTTLSDYEDKGGYQFELKIDQLLQKHEIDRAILLRNPTSLSGGEQTKIGLLRLILAEASFLLLDEPTNHLDLATLSWLENFLVKESIPFIAVSHDRHFLNQCCNRIWHLENGELTIHKGNWSSFSTWRTCERRRIASEREQKLRKIKNLQRAYDQRRSEANKREKFKPTRSVKKNGGLCKRDMFGVTSRDEQAMMRSATAVKKRMERIITKELEELPYLKKGYRLHLSGGKQEGKFLLHISNLSWHWNQKALFTSLNFTVPIGAKVAITGPNGCGKTTLLHLLQGFLPIQQGEISWHDKANLGYCAQLQSHLQETEDVLSLFSTLEKDKLTSIRQMLGCFHITAEMIHRPFRQLSAGEQEKVALILSLHGGNNTLILDEPTNHLDIDARETLEMALSEYEGNLIFVSHDVQFIQNIATHQLDLTKGKFIMIE